MDRKGVAYSVAGGSASDAALVRQLMHGSESALGSLYDRHASAIFAVVFRLTNDRGIAEEVVQETFLTLWNRAEGFDPTLGSLAAWLYTIARNRGTDRLRAARRRVPAVPFSSLMRDESDDPSQLDRLVGSGVAVGAAAAEPGPESAVITSETRTAVLAAIECLKGPERQVILLAYRDGLSQSEIAERLGWPIGTVKTRTRRALRRLRETLDAPSIDHPDRVGSRGSATVLADCCGAAIG